MLLLVQAALAACPEPAPLVDAVTDAVVEARFDDIEPAWDAVEVALRCSPPPSPELLAKLYLSRGAWHHFRGEIDASTLDFAAAHRASPETWIFDLGPQVKDAYTRLSGAEPGEATLTVTDPGCTTWLDGEPTPLPAKVPAGPHLIEVLDTDGRAVHAALVDLSANEERTMEPAFTARCPVALLTQVSPAQAGSPELPPPPQRPFPTWLAVGGGAAVLSVGSALLARAQDSRMDDAKDLQALDDAHQRQQALAWSSYGLAGVAAIGVGLHFTL